VAKILIVDDDEQLRELLVEALTEAGHSVTTAGNGKDALVILGHQTFDLIVSDVQMPLMNGIELLQWVRANVKIPMIMMSGFSRLLELIKPKDIGAKAFLPKPFQPEDLISVVENALTKDVTDAAATEATTNERIPKRY
jgi:DNA-binding NtrC family response regulator